MTTRRRVFGRLVPALAVLLVGACATPPPDTRDLWHSGQLTIGTGPTTGVFFQVGGGYADIISAYLDGYDASAAATAGAADNILRLVDGDVQLAFTFADVAVDAVRGVGRFTAPQPIQALAAIYRNYTHLIVRTDAGIGSIADLRGKRVSTGPVNSGTENISMRLLAAADINPDRDIRRQSLSLPATTMGMADGSLDAMFYAAGLPTTGITELLGTARGAVTFLPLTGLLPALEREHPGTYSEATIPKGTYGLPADVPTVVVSNMIVVTEAMPERLAYALARLIFVHQKELTQTHPEWANVHRESAGQSGAVTLHPGAQRYFRDG